MIRNKIIIISFLIFIVSFLSCKNNNENVSDTQKEVVSNEKYIFDNSFLFTEQEEEILTNKLNQYQKDTSVHFFCFTTDNKENQNINLLTQNIISDLNPPQKKDKYVLIVISYFTREIEVISSENVEDRIDKEKVLELLLSYFKEKKIYLGIEKGFEELYEELRANPPK